jgi:hypothetical protein
VVINDFYVGRPVACPNEANSILLVDPDAVLPLSVSRKSFKTVPYWDPKVFQLLSRVQHFQFSAGNSPKRRGASTTGPFGPASIENILGGFVLE